MTCRLCRGRLLLADIVYSDNTMPKNLIEALWVEPAFRAVLYILERLIKFAEVSDSNN